MKLTTFSVTKFRSIESAHKIEFSDVTVLIGKNNEGKSNFLKALQVAMKLLQTHAGIDTERRRSTISERNVYQWHRDFPIQLQHKKSKTATVFKLEFLINEEERKEFKTLIGSTLNEVLPIEVSIGKEHELEIRLLKPGKGTQSLTKKSKLIAKFIVDKIHFNYIPAVRTESESIDLVSDMVSSELRILEQDPKYKSALATIADLQKPVLDGLAKKLEIPLKEFLPSIKSVQIQITDLSRRYALRRDVDIVVDDGTATSIEHKGDGVKSLAALGLLKNVHTSSEASILAIEEPESHLHPSAINQVYDIIRAISAKSQVILTTHNPLFVDRRNISSNIIIADGDARPAKSISSIRDLLGVRASDNLTNANYVLLVEGIEDAKALHALLPVLSVKIGKALKNNLLVIEPIGGANKLSYHLQLLKSQLCLTHSLLDNDEAGVKAFESAENLQLISNATCTFIKCAGMPKSEFEDVIKPAVYRDALLNEFGVDVLTAAFKGKDKWSDRLSRLFDTNGKMFRNSEQSKAKFLVAEEIIKDPANALINEKRTSIDALVASIEKMIENQVTP
jgi:putative ATP-dependent endonuclease of OLD family